MNYGITLEQAVAQRDAWLNASLALATAQSYSITTAGVTRNLTRANLAEVHNQLKYWESKVAALSGQSRVRYGVPR